MRSFKVLISGIAILALLSNAKAADQNPASLTLQKTQNVSLQNEVHHAIKKGADWLAKAQSKDGYWSTPDYPAVTAIALSALQLQPENNASKAEIAPLKNGYAFLERCVQTNGGIYRKELPSYNTSVCLTALVLANRPEHTQTILRARKFIAGLQVDQGERGKIDTAFDGGIGYGSQDKQPDLSNTSLAVEAMALSKALVKDKPDPEQSDLNWKAAVHFIAACQNLPAYNHEKWASDDPANKGGFIYAPGKSMAGETNLASGKAALRSYGSMSYAGLLSYIYADLKPDDPRVSAVLEWLKANYTVEENPTLGPQGLYYYYHTMAKALSVCGVDQFETTDGRKIKWREELALKLINLQKQDGSWSNENGRWFEKDPALVTAYSLIALDLIYKKL